MVYLSIIRQAEKSLLEKNTLAYFASVLKLLKGHFLTYALNAIRMIQFS
jgi:hypothetical protein